MSKINIAYPSGKKGQIEEAKVRALWKQGKIRKDALYWKEGMEEWQPLASYMEPAVASPPKQATPEIPPPRQANSHYSYTKDPRSLTKFTVIFLWTSLAVELVGALFCGYKLALLVMGTTSWRTFYSESSPLVMTDLLLAFIGILIFLVTAVTFLRWVHRANKNSHGFGAADMRFTPGWCVGYYFIPILNLFRPYQCMKEIHQVSQDPVNWKAQKASSMVSQWWALWILSMIINRIDFQYALTAESFEDLSVSFAVTVVARVIGIVLCVSAIRMVKEIATNQQTLVE